MRPSQDLAEDRDDTESGGEKAGQQVRGLPTPEQEVRERELRARGMALGSGGKLYGGGRSRGGLGGEAVA